MEIKSTSGQASAEPKCPCSSSIILGKRPHSSISLRSSLAPASVSHTGTPLVGLQPEDKWTRICTERVTLQIRDLHSFLSNLNYVLVTEQIEAESCQEDIVGRRNKEVVWEYWGQSWKKRRGRNQTGTNKALAWGPGAH